MCLCVYMCACVSLHSKNPKLEYRMIQSFFTDVIKKYRQALKDIEIEAL